MKKLLQVLVVGMFGLVLMTSAIAGINCQGHGDAVQLSEKA